MDCHVLWHNASTSYMDPEAFRLALNSLLQEIRNVSFLVQKKKNDLPNFEAWYSAWRSRAQGDVVLRWAVEARNRVVKQEDLELHSRASVRISRSWAEEIQSEFDLPPQFPTDQIVAAFIQGAPETPNRGVMTIERRWVDQELPSWEVLAAVAHAYNGLVGLLQLAHKAAGVSICGFEVRRPDCVTEALDIGPACMDQVDEERRLHLDLGTLQQVNEGQYHIGRLTETIVRIGSDDVTREMARKRYGEFRSEGDAIERVKSATVHAKAMLRADHNLATVAWLIKGDQMIGLEPMLFPEDESSWRLIMIRLADRVQRLDADGVVLISECWTAPAKWGEDPRNPRVRATQRPDRSEAIGVTGVTRDGRIASSATLFFRGTEGQIFYGPTVYMDGEALNIDILRPVLRRWRSPVA